MAYTTKTLLTFEAFLVQYGDNPRYEIADGELVEIESTGPHETVSGKLATQIRLSQPIVSPPLKSLQICLDDILPR